MSKGCRIRPEREVGAYARRYELIEWSVPRPVYETLDITTPTDSFPKPGTLMDVFMREEGV